MSRRNEKMPMSVAIFPMMKKVQIEYGTIFGEVQFLFEDEDGNTISFWCDMQLIPSMMNQLKKILKEGRS
jgi:hypothetical protein